MVPPDAVALSLRFREPEVSDAPPDVAAFLGRGSASPREPSSTAHDGDPVGVVPSGAPMSARAPIMVFFQHAAYGIPAFDDPRLPALAWPDTSSWCVRPTVFGYLARVPAPAPAPARPRPRVSWVAAACLPLVMPWTAHAAPAKETPTVQRPARPTIPDVPGDEAAPSDDADATAEAEPEPEATPPEPDPVEPELTAELPPSFGALDPGPSAADQAILDAAWEGVDGFEVDLELKGGSSMRGRVGAVQRDTFTLIRTDDGAVVVLPKSNVATLRVHVPPPIPTKSGTGPLVGGTVLTVISTPVFISGLTFLGICPSCAYLHLPMLIIGGAGLGAGIPLIIRGSRQRQAFNKALAEHRIAMAVGRTRDGWSGGLRLRF